MKVSEPGRHTLVRNRGSGTGGKACYARLYSYSGFKMREPVIESMNDNLYCAYKRPRKNMHGHGAWGWVKKDADSFIPAHR